MSASVDVSLATNALTSSTVAATDREEEAPKSTIKAGTLDAPLYSQLVARRHSAALTEPCP